MNLARTTLAAPVTRQGVGIHTGEESTVTLSPAESAGQGIVFRAVGNGQDIVARAGSVVDTSRCTVLGTADRTFTISTVEHLLSAFAGLGITDAIVTIDGPELPIGDGSATIWMDAVQSVGTRRLEASPLVVPGSFEPVLVTGRGGAFIAAYPTGSALRVTVSVAFEHALVGTQVARFDTATGDYGREIAPARTFGFIEEVEALRKAGLARGGSLDNAVVVYPDRYSSPLRFENEMARHKMLDLMGDMMLSGILPTQLNADIIAVKPSHGLNAVFAGRVADAVRSSATTGAQIVN